jgi:hypothetical protein
MPDTRLDKILTLGTAADRAAFVPDPPTNVLVVWFETDTGASYVWDGAVWVLQSAGSGAGTVTGPVTSTDKAIARWAGVAGTALADSTPIVEDDGRITTLTDPTGLQDASTKAYVDTQIAAAIAAAVGAAQNSFLVSGGQVVWDTAYTFLVSAATYYINGVLYASAAATVTLAAADATFDRLDSIAVDNTGLVIVVPGVPAAQPSTADIDPGTQLRLSIVLVSAATTQPAAATAHLLYADNAGGPTEWNWTASGASINVNSTNSPRHGTKSIEGTATVAGVYAQGQIPAGTLDPNLSALLVLYIQSKAAWSNNRGLQITLRNAGVTEGVPVTIARTGTWGFDSSITGVYQQIAIPIVQFGVIAGTVIDQVRIADFGGPIGFYLDDISFQGGATSQPATGLTQELGDARYRRLAVPLVLSAPADVTGVLPAANVGAHASTHNTGGTDPITALNASVITTGTLAAARLPARTAAIGLVIDGGGSVITAGVKGDLYVPFACTITASTLIADLAGSIVLDVLMSASFATTPTVSIVGGAPPTLSTALTAQDTTLTGWTVAVAAGSRLRVSGTGPSVLTRVTFTLTVTVP